jgi:predicted house-cleaning noncanonical NTP pyrophosphatase (MazG superfamily)
MLQHAYYLLKAYDIRIKCVEPFEPKGHRRRFGKLVRDFVPRTIRKGGERVRSYRADEGELERLLRTKALEEAFELFWSSGAESLVAECVDILEVIEALCRLHNVSSDDLRALAAAKRAARGGFAEGVVLLETRTIPLSDGVKTDPALFEVGDEEGLPRRAGLVDPRPARQGRRLLLPFMPPPPEGGKRGFTIRGASDEELEVSYSPEGIAISFRRRATSLQDQDADEEEVEGQLRIEGFEQT